MKIRVLLAAAVVAVGAIVRLPAAPALMPIEDVKPGMEGIGRTIFEGTELKEFKVHILGVLKNVQAANTGPLEEAAIKRLFERIIDEARHLERVAEEVQSRKHE